MTFRMAGEQTTPLQQWFAEGLTAMLTSSGLRPAEPDEDLRLAFNFIDVDHPKPFRRKAKATFVVSVTETDTQPEDVLKAGYPILIRNLSNLLIYFVRQGSGFRTYFVTLEQGVYPVSYEQGDEAGYFSRVWERLLPLAFSRLVIDNDFATDLAEELWSGDDKTAQIYRAGQKLAEMDLLPAAFPIQELLPEEDFRHLKRLYGIGGLSYGNLSARQADNRFWMSASGVDKSRLERVGEHVLLVTAYDDQRNAMRLSVPPNVQPRRVSVDAIEHWMIYTEHPGVGAILHIHAWMDGIPSTGVNYPCGTLELAQAVADLVRQSEDPTRAVIGLRNHGLTITGPSLDEIFERIDGRILRQVPMV